MGSVSKGMGLGIGLVIGLIFMAIAIPLTCTTMCATGVVGTAAIVAEGERARQEQEAREAATRPAADNKDKIKTPSPQPSPSREREESGRQTDGSRDSDVVSSRPENKDETTIETPVADPPAATTQPVDTRAADYDRTLIEQAAEKAYVGAKKLEDLKSWQAAVTSHARNAHRYPETEYGKRSDRAVRRLMKTHPGLSLPNFGP